MNCSMPLATPFFCVTTPADILSFVPQAVMLLYVVPLQGAVGGTKREHNWKDADSGFKNLIEKYFRRTKAYYGEEPCIFRDCTY